MSLTIITNNHYREILYGFDLTKKERLEFDYLSNADLDTHTFIRYRKCVYDLGEFILTPQNEPARQELNDLSDWHGYQSSSFFSGVVVKFSDDYESVKIGTYVS